MKSYGYICVCRASESTIHICLHRERARDPRDCKYVGRQNFIYIYVGRQNESYAPRTTCVHICRASELHMYVLREYNKSYVLRAIRVALCRGWQNCICMYKYIHVYVGCPNA